MKAAPRSPLTSSCRGLPSRIVGATLATAVSVLLGAVAGAALALLANFIALQ